MPAIPRTIQDVDKDIKNRSDRLERCRHGDQANGLRKEIDRFLDERLELMRRNTDVVAAR